MDFNPLSPDVMHVDINSCFATIEQQANPSLRGKPIAVAAYASPRGCILAASYEAKRMGVKTGMRVFEGKKLCPYLQVLPPDAPKYRAVHLQMKTLLSDYTPRVFPKSIDEFVLHFENCELMYPQGLVPAAEEIKKRIKLEIGDAITVSIGISTNRFLAKQASNYKKPDGLTVIDIHNYQSIYASLLPTDLTGIKSANQARLHANGIYSVMEMYNAPVWKLKAAFSGAPGYYWYLRLRGLPIDDVEFGRRSYGNSYSLPTPFATKEELSPIITKLVTKTSKRVRHAGYIAKGAHLAISYKDGSYWHKGAVSSIPLFSTHDMYQAIMHLFDQTEERPVRNVAVSVFDLSKNTNLQLSLFSNTLRTEKLMKSVDEINDRWGDYVITPARMVTATQAVPDRIAFGGVKELEEIVS
jgi:DNA polymerase-4